MKKYILHLSHTDIRSDSRILKELRALEYFEHFNRVGFGVELEEGASVDARELKAEIHSLGLRTKKFSWLPRPLRYSLNMLELTVVFCIRGIMLRPVVVHCHDTLVLPAGLLIKLITGCKLVYDAHELESNKNGQSRILSKGTLFIEKLCWRRIDLLVSVSESILSWYCNNLGVKEYVLVLNSPEIVGTEGSDSRVRDISFNYLRDRYRIPENQLIFVYLGILGPGRGVEIALEAFASSSMMAHLVLVGYGDLTAQIKTYCDRYKNIHLHEPVPHDQVVTLVRDADVGLCLIENVSLSDYYCLPNKLFEYCFAGLHILGSDFPEIRKVVDQYSLGTCCALEPRKVREAIQSMIDHRPTRVGTDLSELSWDAQAERLVRSYRKLLDIETNVGSAVK